MMLAKSTCSTLAIFIAFSRYPSSPSCVVIATGADFSAILHLVFAPKALSNAALSSVPISIGTPICASGSASVADLFTLCCPLPLAAGDADFTSSLFLGCGSGSIGISVNSCDVNAANCGAGAAVVTLLLLSFLCSPPCVSSAHAPLITSLHRSNLSALC